MGQTDQLEYPSNDLSRLDTMGETVLHEVCRQDHEKSVPLLFGGNSDINHKNEEGYTPLHVAVSKGHVDLVRCLIAEGADPDVVDKLGSSALHIALRRHHINIAIMLLQDGCNIDLVDSLGDAPIHIAAKAGLLPIAQTLCAFGCKVDVPNKMGLYPLHLAAKNGHTELVRCLCLAGCDVQQKYKDGITSEISAFAQGHNEIGELLNRLRNAHVREESISQLIPSTHPVSRVKLKLFGHSGVGKSTFIESLKCGFLASWFRRSVGPASPKGKREHGQDRFSIELKSSDVEEKPLSFETRLETYTRGIQVQQANISGIGDVSLWEYSGHEPYFMTYDHFIGNTNCLHLVLFRLTDPYEVQVQQVLFWIAFLLARIPPHQPLGFCGRGGKAVRIALVATHADAVSRPTATGPVLRVARLVFGRCADLHDAVFVVDDLRALKNYVACHKDKVTQGLPKSTGFLESTCCCLPAWRKSRVCFPALPWQHFVQLVREEVNPLAGEEHMKELVHQLQVMGEVLYITCDNQGVVVLEPSWLCTTIMGYLLSHENQERARVTGIYSADDVQLLFPEAEGTTLLKMLEALEVCTGCETDGEVEYEFPCFNLVETLDGLWAREESRYRVYGGVRLQCRHEHLLAFLFPRLQVHFRRSADGNADPDSDLYQWRRGSKFCSGLVEGLVTLDSTGEAFEIRVRGPEHSEAQCFYFQEDLITVMEQMLAEACPGLLVERHLLSTSQLHDHSPQPHSYPPLTTVASLLQDGVHALLSNPYVADGTQQESLFDLAFFGAKEVFEEGHTSCDEKVRSPLVLIPDLHVSRLPVLSLQSICAALDPPDPMGRDWCMLGVLLGLTDKLPGLDPGDNPALSPTARLLEEWARASDSTVGRLASAMEELERTDAVEQLLSTLPLFRMAPGSKDLGVAVCADCDCRSSSLLQ